MSSMISSGNGSNSLVSAWMIPILFSFGEGLPDTHSGRGEADGSAVVRVIQECPVVKLLVKGDLRCGFGHRFRKGVYENPPTLLFPTKQCCVVRPSLQSGISSFMLKPPPPVTQAGLNPETVGPLEHTLPFALFPDSQ
ncbi:MAG: hypothetical protein BWY45_02187 [Euryarchaeota archaeon ADurb.Bin294]|nr:MAG: hypothetical protein BWY45_02187 [Euryarchaeota archaeon ADurb.Bin294]